MKQKTTAQGQQQYLQLRRVLHAVAGSVFGQYLGVDLTLKQKHKTLHALHAAFAERVEVLSHKNFMGLILGLAPTLYYADESEVFLQKNLLTTQELGGIALVADGRRPKSLPLSKKQLENMRDHREEQLFKVFKNKNLEKKLKELHLYKTPLVNILTMARVWHAGVDVFLANPTKKMFKPVAQVYPSLDVFKPMGKNPEGHIAAYAEALIRHPDATVFYAYPAQLSDLALQLEKRTGRRARLVDFLPQLKFLSLDVLDYTLHQEGMTAFLQGYQIPVHTHLYRADGIFGANVDGDASVIKPVLTAGVFYEFIPLADFEALKGEIKTTHRRLTVDEVEQGGEYGLVVSSISGVLGYNTKLIVRVEQVAPLHLKILGQLSALDGLGQNLTAAQTQAVVAQLNATISQSYQLHINHFMVGEHHGRAALVWVFELNVLPKEINTQILRGIAGSMHATLMKTHGAYRRTFEKEEILPPLFAFVPPGTFLAAGLSGMHCLDFSSDGQLVRTLMEKDSQNTLKLRAARIAKKNVGF